MAHAYFADLIGKQNLSKICQVSVAVIEAELQTNSSTLGVELKTKGIGWKVPKKE